MENQNVTRPPPAGYLDPTSVSEPSRVLTTHIDLDLGVDFEIETLGGTATLSLAVLDETATHVDLDARGLLVRKVVCADSDAGLPFTLEKDVTPIGDRLRISLPAAGGTTPRVKIYYASHGGGMPAGGAVDWTQGRDGGEPFLFTQAQAIHARSFIPCQDTPSVKCTYQAVVRVQPPHEHLTVLMSAVALGRTDDGFQFIQNVPIPSYLIAMAVGDLKGERVSSRCKVWAQPHVVEKARWEFEEVETFLKSAEKIAGDYVWGVYDLLVLPSSFPYGGMENACLTFLTPSLLSGDRSLVNVVAHEIAHSWSGNLVTSRDFRHFWLNEGFTVKLERMILRDVYGKEREGLDGHVGRETLHTFIKKMGDDHPYTCLVQELKEGEDPDDTFSCVPYEKGYAFLSYLEHLINEEEAGDAQVDKYSFDDFMKDYFSTFAHQTITTEDFTKLFSEKFPSVAAKVDFDAWYHNPGVCPSYAPLDLTLVTEASALAADWKTACTTCDESGLRERFADGAEAVRAWDPKQKQLFLSEMVKHIPRDDGGAWWTLESCEIFAEFYQFDAETNSEIKMQWCLIGLRAKRQKNLDITTEFLNSIGRMKFVRPLFNELAKKYPGMDYARKLFAEVKDGYHDICVKMVSRDLGIEE